MLTKTEKDLRPCSLYNLSQVACVPGKPWTEFLDFIHLSLFNVIGSFNAAAIGHVERFGNVLNVLLGWFWTIKLFSKAAFFAKYLILGKFERCRIADWGTLQLLVHFILSFKQDFYLVFAGMLWLGRSLLASWDLPPRFSFCWPCFWHILITMQYRHPLVYSITHS